jgi:hypothetical protein
MDGVVRNVVDLAARVYANSELSSEAYVRWQYFSNPAGQAEIQLELDEQGAVAHYAVVPLEYQLDGHVLKGSLSLNTMTREDQRGKGLFRRLAENTFANLPDREIMFTIGFPNNQSLPGFIKSLGFEHIGTVPMMIRPLNYWAMLHRLLRSAARRKGAELKFVVNPSSRFRSKKWCVRMLDLTADAPLMIGLLDQLLQRHRCATVRSLAYLSWRYEQCPTRNYTILGVSAGNEETIVGFVVLRSVELFGLRCGIIVDLIGSEGPETDESLGFLLDVAMKQFRAAQLDAVIAACTPGCQESKQLKRCGFITIPNRWHPQPLHVILRKHKQATNENLMCDFNNWFLTFGDYDVL